MTPMMELRSTTSRTRSTDNHLKSTIRKQNRINLKDSSTKAMNQRLLRFISIFEYVDY